MIKTKIYLFVIVFLSIISCTTDTETESNNITERPKESYFNLVINGENVTNTGYNYTSKTENIFTMYFFYGFLSFDEDGHFGNLKIIPPTDINKQFYSYINFSSNFFNFKLISIDEITKTVKGSYSGYIYANPYDLNSEKKFVSGDFYTNYENVSPTYQGLKNHATINGKDWNRTNKYSTREAGMNNNNITQHDLSDDEYKIMVHYNLQNIDVATYYFTNNDTTNKIQLAKFDTVTNTYINYNCSGELKITQKEGNILSGEYNFVVRDPIDNSYKFQVTGGEFKLVYVYFP